MYLGLQSFHGSQMVSDCAPSQQKKLLSKLTLFYLEIICSITALLVTFSSFLLFMFISTILGLILHSTLPYKNNCAQGRSLRLLLWYTVFSLIPSVYKVMTKSSLRVSSVSKSFRISNLIHFLLDIYLL